MSPGKTGPGNTRGTITRHLGAQPGPAIYTPLVGSFAAAVTQTPAEEFWRSVDAQTRGLARTAQLFGLDAVTVGLDPLVLADSAGCDVGWTAGGGELRSPPSAAADPDAALARGAAAVAVEACRRLRALLPGSVDVIGVLPGVATLADALAGAPDEDERQAHRQAGRLVVALAREYGEAGVGALLLLDAAEHLTGPVVPREVAKVERVLANTAAFFGMALLRHEPDGVRVPAERVAPAAVVLPARGGDPGGPVPRAVPVTPGERELPPARWYTSAGALDPATAPEALLDLVAAIRGT